MARIAKTTFVVTDDIDGSELPEDTQPTIFGWNGKQYEIWLSEKNHDELDKFLTKFVDNAAEKRAAPATRQTAATAAPSNFFKEIGFERPELEEIWQKMQKDDEAATSDITMGSKRLSNDFKDYVRKNISNYK